LRLCVLCLCLGLEDGIDVSFVRSVLKMIIRVQRLVGRPSFREQVLQTNLQTCEALRSKSLERVKRSLSLGHAMFVTAFWLKY
jgi:riboflavin transporter FmnP